MSNQRKKPEEMDVPADRKSNLAKVTFWMDRELLQKWNVYCDQHGTSRSNLIRDSVNTRVLGENTKFEVSTASIEKAMDQQNKMIAALQSQLEYFKNMPVGGMGTASMESSINEKVFEAIGTEFVNPLKLHVDGVDDGVVLNAIPSMIALNLLERNEKGWVKRNASNL